MIKNAIELPGINNARELGGYSCGDSYIKKGMLIRCGSLVSASPKTFRILSEKYRVQTIIDFRMKAEQYSCPDPVINGAKGIGLSVVELEDFPDVGTEFFEEFVKPDADRMKLFELSYQAGVITYDIYDMFLLSERGKAAYRKFFEILLETDPDRGAVLWHCTDGKDRTGCAAMLLLSALGADRKTILYDYMLTNEFNREMLDYLKETAQKSGMSREKLEALYFINGGVAESYMLRALEVLDERYGGAVGYLREELSIGDNEINLLRKKYLE
jgi:protein-tyrosine phosphatase